jgi:hypothetical protein
MALRTEQAARTVATIKLWVHGRLWDRPLPRVTYRALGDGIFRLPPKIEHTRDRRIAHRRISWHRGSYLTGMSHLVADSALALRPPSDEVETPPVVLVELLAALEVRLVDSLREKGIRAISLVGISRFCVEEGIHGSNQ